MNAFSRSTVLILKKMIITSHDPITTAFIQYIWVIATQTAAVHVVSNYTAGLQKEFPLQI